MKKYYLVKLRPGGSLEKKTAILEKHFEANTREEVEDEIAYMSVGYMLQNFVIIYTDELPKQMTGEALYEMMLDETAWPIGDRVKEGERV